MGCGETGLSEGFIAKERGGMNGLDRIEVERSGVEFADGPETCQKCLRYWVIAIRSSSLGRWGSVHAYMQAGSQPALA